MEWTMTGNGGGSGPVTPVVNEMLLHDVYDLPLEVLRGAGPRRELHKEEEQSSCQTSWMYPASQTPRTPISS